MSPTVHRKYKYFLSTVQAAEDRQQKFQFCRLPFDVTSCLISLLPEQMGISPLLRGRNLKGYGQLAQIRIIYKK